MKKIFRIYGKKGYIGEFESASGFAELSTKEKNCGNFIWSVTSPNENTTSIRLAQNPTEIGIDVHGTIWLGEYRDSKRLWPEISPSDEMVLVANELANVIDGLEKVGCKNG
jgi:hypothetical protein